MSPSVNALRMKPAGMACAALALSTCALAGGVDRTSHSLSPLFEKGAHLSVETYASRPQIQGTDAWGQSTGQVAPRFAQWGFAYKQDVDARNSVLIMLTRPYGLDIDYDRQSSRLFGGTQARISTYELMGALRHRWTERWAVHGGLRVQRSEGHVALNGLAFGPLNGYRVDFAPSTRPG